MTLQSLAIPANRRQQNLRFAIPGGPKWVAMWWKAVTCATTQNPSQCLLWGSSCPTVSLIITGKSFWSTWSWSYHQYMDTTPSWYLWTTSKCAHIIPTMSTYKLLSKMVVATHLFMHAPPLQGGLQHRKQKNQQCMSLDVDTGSSTPASSWSTHLQIILWVHVRCSNRGPNWNVKSHFQWLNKFFSLYEDGPLIWGDVDVTDIFWV